MSIDKLLGIKYTPKDIRRLEKKYLRRRKTALRIAKKAYYLVYGKKMTKKKVRDHE